MFLKGDVDVHKLNLGAGTSTLQAHVHLLGVRSLATSSLCFKNITKSLFTVRCNLQLVSIETSTSTAKEHILPAIMHGSHACTRTRISNTGQCSTAESILSSHIYWFPHISHNRAYMYLTFSLATCHHWKAEQFPIHRVLLLILAPDRFFQNLFPEQ